MMVGGIVDVMHKNLSYCVNKLIAKSSSIIFIKYINIRNIIIYLCMVNCSLFGSLSLAGDNENALHNVKITSIYESALSTIKLDEKIQKIAGIQTQVLDVAASNLSRDSF